MFETLVFVGMRGRQSVTYRLVGYDEANRKIELQRFHELDKKPSVVFRTDKEACDFLHFCIDNKRDIQFKDAIGVAEQMRFSVTSRTTKYSLGLDY